MNKNRNNKRSLSYIAIYILFLLIVCSSFAVSAKEVKVLFVGNSYTYVNNLPSLISSLATSTGDQLVYSSSAPGGYTFEQHSADANTLGLIAQGDWDYVVLQEQSQRPSFPDAQVEQDVYPYARKLDSLVKAANPCTKTVFYMTWGRKNGDASNCQFFPPLCTYAGMDSMLQLRYGIMADSNNAVISPVAKVWRRLRTNNPTLELYDADESHPSLKGSYAAACAFYAVLYGKDPSLCSYTAGLAASDVQILKNAAKTVAYDSLATWYKHDPLPAAQFSYTVNGNVVNFQNSSQAADAYKWYFGDGDSSAVASPAHTYATVGNYSVKLIASSCGFDDTSIVLVQMNGTGIDDILQWGDVSIYPNPAGDLVTIESNESINHVSVFNALGNLVAEMPSAAGKKLNMNISHLPGGVYYLRLRTQNLDLRKRLLKR